jgi:uncharacterized membrane protein YphA (DoxX/SURF4 family)
MMPYSTKYSYFLLRFGVAAVFFWFGIDKFFHPTYWINAWIPAWTIALAAKIGISGTQLVYLYGIFETLIGLSLVTGVFIRFFSLIGVLILLFTLIFYGVNDITVRDIGLIAVLLAFIVWPETNR